MTTQPNEQPDETTDEPRRYDAPNQEVVRTMNDDQTPVEPEPVEPEPVEPDPQPEPVEPDPVPDDA